MNTRGNEYTECIDVDVHYYGRKETRGWLKACPMDDRTALVHMMEEFSREMER